MRRAGVAANARYEWEGAHTSSISFSDGCRFLGGFRDDFLSPFSFRPPVTFSFDFKAALFVFLLDFLVSFSVPAFFFFFFFKIFNSDVLPASVKAEARTAWICSNC